LVLTLGDSSPTFDFDLLDLSLDLILVRVSFLNLGSYFLGMWISVP
jgi:hypothetical protein